MQIQKRNNAVFQCEFSAFTFLEALFNLLIVTIIASLLPLCYQTLSKTISLSELTKSSEWFLFHTQIIQETKNKSIKLHGENSLCFYDQDKVVCYEKKNQVYRRQVNGKGHEILLTNVENIKIMESADTFILSFTFLNKDSRELRFPKQEVSNE